MVARGTAPLLFTFTALLAFACSSDPATSGPGTTSAASSSGASSSSGAGGGADTGGAGGGGAGGQADILDELEAIPGIEVSEVPSKLKGYRRFMLTFDQPADHNDPGGLHFKERAVLEHRDPSAPFVLATTGYNIYPQYEYVSEPTELLTANELLVEERFFSPSRPSPADWSLLTIEQAAADHHAIVAALKPLYPARWISTGGSKGGMTSIYHRRFYPADVDATVAYVAPESFGAADPRYVTFLEQVGDQGCRDALEAFQGVALDRRAAMIAMMQAEASKKGFVYTFLGVDRALEYALVELPFTSWQYYDASLCPTIPAAASTDAQVWAFLNKIDPPSFWSDDSMATYEPYYYQSGTQLGYPAYADDYLAPKMMYPGTDVASTFVMPGKAVVFHPESMTDISSWVTTSGKSLLFIYGENDPYSAAAFDIGKAEDSYRLFVPAGNHGASIADLTDPDKQKALDALAAWSGVTPMKPAAPSPSSAVRALLGRRRRLSP